MPSRKSIIPADYAHWLTSLKSRISSAQQYLDGLIGQQPTDQLPRRQFVQGALAQIGGHGGKRKGRKMIELEYVLFASPDKTAWDQL